MVNFYKLKMKSVKWAFEKDMPIKWNLIIEK